VFRASIAGGRKDRWRFAGRELTDRQLIAKAQSYERRAG
jgi:hypothetical protein